MAYTFGYRIDGKKATIVAYKCLDCQYTTRDEHFIKAKKCPMCGKRFEPKDLVAGEVRLLNPMVLRKEGVKIPNAVFSLYKGSSKKSRKIHWSINGKYALCMASVSDKVEPSNKHNMCINCKKLKKRGFAR